MKKNILLLKLISSILALILCVISFILFVLYEKNYNLIFLYLGPVLEGYLTYKCYKDFQNR